MEIRLSTRQNNDHLWNIINDQKMHILEFYHKSQKEAHVIAL